MKEKEFKKKGYKCTVHQKPQKGGGVDLVRIDAKMHKIDSADIMRYWTNPPLEKMSMIKEIKTIEKLDNGDEIFYMRFKMPLMNDRDNICLVH